MVRVHEESRIDGRRQTATYERPHAAYGWLAVVLPLLLGDAGLKGIGLRSRCIRGPGSLFADRASMLNRGATATEPPSPEGCHPHCPHALGLPDSLYFGTMAGVRGFADPNVQINPDGRTTFQQLVTDPGDINPRRLQSLNLFERLWQLVLFLLGLFIPKERSLLNADVTQLTPWHINYLGGDWHKATQCYGGGDNSWEAGHISFNGGLSNKWVSTNTPYSWGFFNRADVPIHFDIAEGWTIGDMYQEGILAATSPNRVLWMSGTVNSPGSPNNPDGNGNMILDNQASPGCKKPRVNCFPFTWKTIPEYWQEAGVDWQLYQDPDNFEDNSLAYFVQYQKASKDSELRKRGNSYLGLKRFYEDAAAGKLPEISIIVGPAELAEHMPYLPSDGAWLQKQVVDAVTHSPNYNETALILSYDEVGGYGDHVVPFQAPKGTPGEWIEDPYGLVGETAIGPGYRLPFYIISPWTRGSQVFTEHADHTSQIMFLETWLEAKGYSGIRSKEMSPWRRAHMSNLPDLSLPNITRAETPLTWSPPKIRPDGPLGSNSDNYIGAAMCQARYKTAHPPVPYGRENANADPARLVEEGFKQVRGSLTEGRYLTVEMGGFALTNEGTESSNLTISKATPKHEDIRQRWILRLVGEQGGNTFNIRSAFDLSYISTNQTLERSRANAQIYAITDLGNGQGHVLTARKLTGSIENGKSELRKEFVERQILGVRDGVVEFGHKIMGWKIFSVTYHS
ncbi:non-hemolytic phospholipase C precursor, putative [Glarea lozoyensis ATCC 20868]|uniref:Non-hemolytic phospholipase C, putative n=1 Tax=Glarea lozoyensis (strain ATCC 20868 / MF5171) TaxID=1116229 RepID=S3DYM3_GLAL2|nr:non-hemolytic phospholipase C precursor, putative [Glarea lozoyensis ATCC 20868]EPE37041.1 non-hemolytic phospholipase C precursor, putative [Glarea lozoyensis ATCC 20868]